MPENDDARLYPEAALGDRLLLLEPGLTAGAAAEPAGIRESAESIWAGKWTILLAVVLGTVCATAISFLEEPAYESDTTLEITGPTDNSFGVNTGPNLAYTTDSYIQTQAKMLQSTSLRQRVAARMRERGNGYGWTPDRLLAWSRTLGVKAKTVAPERALPPVTLKVRAIEDTHLVQITSESPDPRFASDYANTIADEYIQSNLEARWDASHRTTEWLTRQLEDLRKKLEQSENALQAYSRQNGLAMTGTLEAVQDEKLKELEGELSKATSDRVAAQSVYETTAGSPPDSVPQIVDNERLSDYHMRLAELRREAAELSTIYAPEHPKVKRVHAQIEEMEATYRREAQSVLAGIRNNYLTALRRETLLKRAYQTQATLVSDQAAKAIPYDVLKREVETNRALYGSLLQKVKEAGVMSAMAAVSVRVVDRAAPAAHPFKPNLGSNLLKGFGSGLAFGLIFVVARDRAGRSLRGPGDSRAYLRIPELGVIPEEPERPKLFRVGAGRFSGTKLLSISGSSDGQRVELITWQNSPSVIAESYRGAVTSILSRGAQSDRARVILVTSASRGEGKSTTVSNLGIGLAEVKRRVLLIDADMRKPRLHEIFGQPNELGLSDLLRQDESGRVLPISALARPTGVANLFLLPGGSGALSVSNLLYSGRMPELLRLCRDNFDVVLIDTPPVLCVADSRILARLADTAILVVRAGRTTRETALRALDQLSADGVHVMGTILNGWNIRSKSRYGAYVYEYSS